MSSTTPETPPAARTREVRATPNATTTGACAESGLSLRTFLTAPLVALQFLTVLPPVVRRAPTVADLGTADAFFPAVGLLLGLGLAGADLALSGLVASTVRDVLLVALLAGATGALHLDGFVDTFDGLFAPGDPARRLEIMRDPRAGSFGVAALTLVLLLKWSAMSVLVPPLRLPGLLLAPTLARYAMVVTAAAFPYARPEGLGAGYHRAARGLPLVVAGATAATASTLLFGVAGLALMAVATGLALTIGWWALRRIGGVTGDVYGAVCELTEAVMLLALSAAHGRAWVDVWLVRG